MANRCLGNACSKSLEAEMMPDKYKNASAKQRHKAERCYYFTIGSRLPCYILISLRSLYISTDSTTLLLYTYIMFLCN